MRFLKEILGDCISLSICLFLWFYHKRQAGGEE
jgi:hypothetical protein